eukprot:TRINITY_DN21669_c0_g1_i1.p1 TRINITY_DN21669_c0_g1~~TRINITY_DN21669_c0_g1_i1.p1  ORF type:complete len:201 (+),score=34.44 TRINITY_DN21669_c0_g1_i1:36-638(+)
MSSSSSKNSSGAESLTRDDFLKRMRGSWYVVQSNLALWKKDKNPVITYGKFKEKTGRLRDTVSRTHKLPCCCGWKDDQILGYDTFQCMENGKLKFQWRGTGCIDFFITSDWTFHAIGNTNGEEWAVTTFEKTLFTTAGADYYGRAPTLSAAALNDINNLVMNDKELARITSMNGGMFNCIHDNLPANNNNSVAINVKTKY